jgi:hypothetical protein
MRRSDMKLHLQGLKNQFPIWRRREKEKWKFSRFNRDCVNAIFTISTMKNIKYVCSSWSLFLMNSNRKINYIIVLWFALLLREDIVGFYLNKKKTKPWIQWVFMPCEWTKYIQKKIFTILWQHTTLGLTHRWLFEKHSAILYNIHKYIRHSLQTQQELYLYWMWEVEEKRRSRKKNI